MITETAITARLRSELGFDADNEPDSELKLELGSGKDCRPEEEEVWMLEVSDIWAKAVLGGESLLLTAIVAPPVMGTVSAPSARSTKVISRSIQGYVCLERKIQCQCPFEACEMSSGCVRSIGDLFLKTCLSRVQCRTCESYTVGMSKCIVVSCRQFWID